jgi:hypothetical protein
VQALIDEQDDPALRAFGFLHHIPANVINLLCHTEQRPTNDELRWLYYPLKMAMRHRSGEYWAWAD